MNSYPMMNQMSNMPNVSNMANMPYKHHMHHMHHQAIINHPVDKCVVECLMSLMGRIVILETTRGRLDGCIIDVKQDHVVLEERHKKFIVRICEIVWIMPE
ncbi:DUF2642 domain-containing protein [Paenibacillus motobuensis]|uniref:DUF2642 domain-containing protein n=1 Tax=Paenibacillus motobuensis TaxID=295324 RepID=A0ABN0Y0E3_9BACL